jgi:ketosteroid isomerase-like protein
MASVAQTILRIEKEMVRDFNARKIDELLAHFDSKVIGFSSTQHERVAGRQAMQKTFQYYLQAASRIRYQIEQPQVHVFGDTAVATFYWTVELGAGRPRHVIKGRGSHVFLQKDDQWVIVHEHFSRAH